MFMCIYIYIYVTFKSRGLLGPADQRRLLVVRIPGLL